VERVASIFRAEECAKQEISMQEGSKLFGLSFDPEDFLLGLLFDPE
jgi:hypothetical protein